MGGAAYAYVVFLSTPSARRATCISCTLVISIEFLSTPSTRRATRVSSISSWESGISIHALLAEGDSKLADKIGIIIS